MAVAPMGAVLRQFSRLFAGGSLSGLTEGQLLDRFVKTRDEAAFAALVERFGPMVLGVCRKLLADPHAAEDAFQATFLVLVQRAGAIRDGDLLGNWLYGVALKVAKRARADRSKKQSREKGGEDVDAKSGFDPATLAEFDVGPILHEELGRLPENYRKPLVVCFLDGRSHEEAAKLLRWPVGTVKGRIARGKELLRDRLGRRGVTITSAAIAAMLSETASAMVPPILIDSTVKAAMAIAAGGMLAAGTYSATAVTLSEGVVASMTMTKFKLIAAVLVTLGTVGAGAGVMARQQETTKTTTEKVEVKRADTDRKTTIEKVATPAIPERPPGFLVDEGFVKPIVPASPIPLDDEPKVEVLASPKEMSAKWVKAAGDYLIETAESYGTGKTGLGYVVAAGKALMEARIAADEGARITAIESYVILLRKAIREETARIPLGSGSVANVKAAESNLASAELMLAKARSGEVVASKIQPGDSPDDEDSPEKNKQIREILAKPIHLAFPNETPLEEVIKFIKETTSNPGLVQGIPIYVDPIGMQQAEKTMQSTVTIDLAGIPLRTSLRLALKQLDLSYYIKDGLLIISSPESDTFPESALTALEKAQKAERKAEEREARAKNGQGGGAMGGGFR